ncbi:Aste57867_18353 [Aphanomyces stellatus]|uniref:Aste57867_18353 protein n=1 Tax=Aphanomyces stellatus TaxID=120398 RepID=A0A485L9U9_9STRA|nr:hypothetical protein As57867_018291 [Aphanomyces stellatus]VFT95089.1 Aste57867_18353 [Aphanomyces stellatus]
MRALFLIGALFAAVTLWAITLTSSIPSSFYQVSTGPNVKTRRTVLEKRAMAIAFVQKQLQANPFIPGVSLSVVYQNQTVIATGFGTNQYGKTTVPVTGHSVFQIGSYSKTFIALGIGKLVDDGLVHWHDPIKQHLPWFQLVDKYAEQYTTMADLLAMNSVFGNPEGDIPLIFGVLPTDRDLVERLAFFNTTRAFRPGYMYANVNFAILGQVIEHVTKQHWFAFIKTTFLDPLGMNETFGRLADVTNMDELSGGHLACGGHVLGPYDLTSSMVANTPSSDFLAAGSILSSANDLAKLSLFLLNHGRGILKSPKIVQDMTTGHTVLPPDVEGVNIYGQRFHADGGVRASGFGFDTVGQVMYGYSYYDKGGDTPSMTHRNGFVPSQGLGVTLGANVKSHTNAEKFLLDRLRSYVLGIFLDISLAELDATWDAAVALFHPKTTPCNAQLFGGLPWGDAIIPVETLPLLVGTYVALASPGYVGNVTVAKQGQGLTLHYGAYARPLVATKGNPTTFVWALDFEAVKLTVEWTGGANGTARLSVLGMTFLRTGNPNTPVTGHSVLQIGTFIKTFTALGIGKLVDDGLVKWSDPVKQHLPWFRLMDKYAEQYTTLADLLAMKSVFGNHEGDIPMIWGVVPTDRATVERLAFFNTSQSMRAGYVYSNLNFENLGQVIEHVTNQPWFTFIKTTYLDPLGMNETFGRPMDVTNVDDLSGGHFACNDQVLGPYNLTSFMTATTAGADFLAAGSILTSANDLAKFSHSLLNHGRGILKSPQIIQDMTTGHNVLPAPVDGVDARGKLFHPDGSVKAAVYGFDTVGNIMYGYVYYDKNGAMATMHHHNGFVPSQGLGVTMTTSVQVASRAHLVLWERVRSYVLGIFLDVPQATLDATWDEALVQFHPQRGWNATPIITAASRGAIPFPMQPKPYQRRLQRQSDRTQARPGLDVALWRVHETLISDDPQPHDGVCLDVGL